MLSEFSYYLGVLFAAVSGGLSLNEAYRFWRDQRFYRNLTGEVYGASMYKKGPESDRLFRSKVDSMCTVVRDSVNRQLGVGRLNIDEGLKLKHQIGDLSKDIQYSTRGQFWKARFLTKRKLAKQDKKAVNSLSLATSLLNSGNPDSLYDECSVAIEDAREALTKRSLLVTIAER